MDFTEENLTQRVANAVELFKSGYNCSQAVVAAFADIYGYTRDQSLKMSSSFGGGIGRMRETCGAACGLFMLAGLEKGATEATDRAGKSDTYALVQELAKKFEEINGSLCCAELLGLRDKKDNNSPEASERTTAYYAKRPCAQMVESAAQLWADYLMEEYVQKH